MQRRGRKTCWLVGGPPFASNRCTHTPGAPSNTNTGLLRTCVGRRSTRSVLHGAAWAIASSRNISRTFMSLTFSASGDTSPFNLICEHMAASSNPCRRLTYFSVLRSCLRRTATAGAKGQRKPGPAADGVRAPGLVAGAVAGLGLIA